MKKLLGLGLLACLAFTGCAPVVLASEIQQVAAAATGNANQEVDIDAAGAVALFLKQPRAEQNVQTIKISRSGLVLILSLAGKVPVTTPTESK